MSPVKGLDSIKIYPQTLLKAFPNVKGENLTTVPQGDNVAVFEAFYEYF